MFVAGELEIVLSRRISASEKLGGGGGAEIVKKDYVFF